MSEYAIALFGFIALIGIVLYFVFFKSGGSALTTSALQTDSLTQTEQVNTYQTDVSRHPEQEPFNYRATSSTYSYYSGA
jgi:hypothetical protein